MFRNRAYSLVNIIGLAVGMACCLLISLWIANELNYDRSHEYADRIYRVLRITPPGESMVGESRDSYTVPVYAPAFRQNIPEVEYSSRYMVAYQEILINRDEVKSYRKDLAFGDEDFFRIFGYPFLRGNPETALTAPQSIVFTEELAEFYFGDENPMGQTVTFLDTSFTVTGIIGELPGNSHIKFSCIARLKDIDTPDDNWFHPWYRTFVRLHDGASVSAATETMHAVIAKLGGDDADKIQLQPLTDIHLYNKGIRDRPRGDIRHLRIFGAIAILIILIACVNFINLTTARAVTRSREVGVRKVVGARRASLVKQFFIETLIIAMVAAILAFVLIEIFLPVFNNLAGKQLDLHSLGMRRILSAMAVLVMVISVIAGAYPAALLSSFQPVQVLKASSFVGGRRFTLRRILVISQFALTLVLLLCTLTVYRQYYYMRNTDLGCNLKDVIYVKKDGLMWDKYPALKQELLTIPAVEGVASVSRMLPLGSYRYTNTDWEGRELIEEFLWTHHAISGKDFINLFEIQLIEGRNFSEMYPEEPLPEVLVNEAFVHSTGLKDPLGKWVSCHLWDDQKRQIVGVVKNYHSNSLHAEILPTVISCDPYPCRYLAVKIQPNDVQATLASIEAVMLQIDPTVPFEYAFLYDKYDVYYKRERHLGMLTGAFSGLAILLACLGLLGLVAFLTEQRTKEIGIRKVLGASVFGIVRLLSKEFLILVAVANVIAWPVGYFLMNQWLKNFAYKTDLGWHLFLLAGGLALVIAMATMCIPAMRAAFANPVNALRHE